MDSKIKKVLYKRFLSLLLTLLVLFSQFLNASAPSVYAASSPWAQTDWEGGSGQTSWSDATKFSSSSNVTTSVANQITLTNSEKFANTGFETDLSSWSGTQSYFLDDEYTDTLAAGSVNGTTSTPSGDTRVVTDTGHYLSLGSGLLSITGDYATKDPGIWYKAVTRAAGKMMTGSLVESGSGVGYFGFANSQNSSGGFPDEFCIAGTTIYVRGCTITIPSAITLGTSYQYALILRSGGTFAFIRGGTQYPNWTLFYHDVLDGTSTLYPGFATATLTGTLDYIRVPSTTWIPAPLAYDTFTTNGRTSTETTGPDGQTAPSLAWTGSTWTNASGTAGDTPTLGPELNSGNLVVGNWYSITATTTNHFCTGCVVGNVFRATATTAIDASDKVELITLSSAFRSVSTSTGDVLADTNVTLTSGTQGGLVLNLDSASSPANFVIAYHDGTNVHLDKNVGGTYTPLINTAAAYSPGATLRVIKNGSTYTVFYNNARIGNPQTISDHNNSDAGQPLLSANTNHGLFSTYSGNTLDNFALWAMGTSGEYASIPAEDLTVSRDTSVYHAGVASAKLIAAGNNSNFYQKVNVGDTGTYNLSAYAYIDGSTAVDGTYSKLEANGSAITTAYTSVGGGWYKLTGTVTGTVSSVGYGVQIMAGKTVYVDDMSLNGYSASGTLTSSIFDTGNTQNWGTLTYAATTPTNTSVTVKIRTSNDSGMSGATAFGSCTAISSGSDISSNSCVTDGQRYAQFLITESTTNNSITPTFTSFSLGFSPSGPTGLSGSVVNTSSITWSWTDNADSESGFYVQDMGSATKCIVSSPSAGTGSVVSCTETGLSPNTSYTRKVVAYYTGGNSDPFGNVTLVTFSTAPTTSNVTSSPVVSTWTNGTFTFTNGIGFGAGGVQYFRYVWDTSPTHVFTGSETQWSASTLVKTATLDSNSWYLHLTGYNSSDVANGGIDLGPYWFDGTPPTTPGSPGTTTPTNSTSQTWAWTIATDALSGVANYAWRVVTNLGAGVTSGTTGSTSIVTNLAQGIYNLFVKATDNASNQGIESSGSVTVDTTGPITTDNVDGLIHNSTVTVTLNCTNSVGLGCVNTYYTTDGSTPTTSSPSGTGSTTTFTLSADGTYTIKYFSVDAANNHELVKTANYQVRIDHTAASSGRTYYVDQTYGKDTYNGTDNNVNDGISNGPWKTLAKVNGLVCGSGVGQLNAGDRVFFRKGELWNEQLTIPCSGSAGNSITFGAYGSGNNPIIDGTSAATGWSVYSGNIYVANVSPSVARVFVDNNFLTPAHYPDSGYSTITSTPSDRVSLTSTSFNPPSADLSGANIFIKEESWFVENRTVTTYDSVAHKINWTDNTTYPIPSANYGFYLTNKLWMLDTAGEWFYDSSTNNLYVWLSDSSNPTSHSINVSTPSSTGIIASNQSYFTIQDISIQNTGSDGVQLNTVSNATLQRLNISFAGRYGIYANGGTSNNLLINNNTISKAQTIAIFASGLTGSSITISNNTVTDTGNFGLTMSPAPGLDAAVNIATSNNVLVQGNSISNSKYIGISFSGNNNIIQNNLVNNSCLLLDDCGGIYTNGNLGTGNQILNNIVTNSIGNFSGTPYTYTQAHGIYLDANSNNITVSGNTVNNVDRGIFIHDSYSQTITGNTVYGARFSGLLVTEDSSVPSGTVKNNIINGNIFLNNSSSYPSAEFDGNLGNVNFGSYNSNYYSGIYFGYPITRLITNIRTNYSLADWENASGQDSTSNDIGSFFSAAASKVTGYLGNNLVTNSIFYSDVSGWTTDSGSSYIGWSAGCGLDSGCLHVPANVGLPGLRVESPSFSVQSGSVYEVSFSIISGTKSSGTVLVRRETSPYTVYGTKAISIPANTRQDVSFTITASDTLTNNPSIEFNMNGADYYIDNVSIRPVTAFIHSISDDSLIYTNSTSNTTSINLGTQKYCDVNNNSVSGSFSLSSYSSKVLLNCFNNNDRVCNNHEIHASAPLDCPSVTDEGTSAGLDAPFQMGSDKPDISGNVRIYSQGKFRNINTPSGTTANFTISPQTGFTPGSHFPWMDISISIWNTNGDYHKSWTESSSVIGHTSTLHTIGDLGPYKFYYVSVDSVLGNNIEGTLGTFCLRGVCQANSQGKISFIYSGGYSTHTFDIMQGNGNSVAPSPWIQSDWEGGSGQNYFSDATKFSSSANVVTSTPNQITLSPPERFTNTGFETNLSGWSGTQSYTLDDEFSDTKSAGLVNSTPAVPGPGTRSATDTNSKISVGSGVLNFSTGESANDGVWYDNLPRSAGESLTGIITPGDTNGIPAIGWATATTGPINDSLGLNTTTGLQVTPNGGSAVTVGSYAASTAYKIASILRSTGTYWFIKGGAFTNWSLLWQSSTGNGYANPAVQSQNTTGNFTAGSVHVPVTTWLPTPLVYDTFSTNGSTSTEVAGPDNQITPVLPWTGSTWTDSAGVVSNSPTAGSELVINGNMESGNPPTSWTIVNATVTSAADERTGGVGTQSIDVQPTSGFGNAIQVASGVKDNWYTASVWSKRVSGSNVLDFVIQNQHSPFATGVQLLGNSTSWTNQKGTYRNTDSSGATNVFLYGPIVGEDYRYDDVSIKPLTTSSLFRTVDSGSPDVFVETAVTGPTSTSKIQGGLVLNLDSTSNPANFILVYLDGSGNIKVDESVSGVYTNRASTAISYVTGGILRAVKYGTSLDVYYNGAKVGGTLTMTPNTNTRDGLFSTSSTNTFDNFVIWPRSGYTDAPFEDLTTTRDIGTTHLASTGSAKLIAGGTNEDFTQSINLGDNNTYNFSAYAYTTGAPVTAADLQLFAGSAVQTSYSDAGGGWYYLTATITGSTLPAGYGVQVKSGKTVYVDDFSLKPQVLIGTLTSSIFDAGSAQVWGNLNYTATTPAGTSVSVKVITSDSPDISTDFSACSALLPGSNISTSNCNFGGEYARYQITLSSTDLTQTPVFSNIAINFAPFIGTTGPPVCSSAAPSGPNPWLYSAVAGNGDSITLKFTNWQSNVDHFVLEYGTSQNSYQYGANNIGGSGINSYTVNFLSPNTKYYFRVRAGNGCASGIWSNEISASTLGLISNSNLGIISSQLTPIQNEPKQNKISNPLIKSGTQGYIVKIMVTDASGKPVTGAIVTLHSTPKQALTDKNGIVQFTNIEGGQHQISISYSGYKGQESVNLSGDYKEFDINLKVQKQNELLSPQAIAIIGAMGFVIIVLTILLIRAKRNHQTSKLI